MIDSITDGPLSCERVLIVDDDLEVLESLGELLVSEGVWVVHGARSLAEAEGLLAQGFRPSAVVLDLLLDGDHGEDFAHRLKADPAYRGVPVIALSGDHVALEQVGSVVERSLLKPADPAELMTALREVCLLETAGARAA